MQEFPHHYKVAADAKPEGTVVLTSDGLDDLASAAPAEFGGPGDQWSPETLLSAAVADCFILGFKAIARASHFPWNSLQCHVEGVLERIDHVTRFTEFKVHATLEIPADADEERARRLLEKADATCLVTNSMTSTVHLETVVSKAV
ncbi:MAG TPA: OsmC family protein [Gammaproteobacteria bacterium]|nr:OsmC family protein [Gammaproteobacteria bacterium]